MQDGSCQAGACSRDLEELAYVRHALARRTHHAAKSYVFSFCSLLTDLLRQPANSALLHTAQPRPAVEQRHLLH